MLFAPITYYQKFVVLYSSYFALSESAIYKILTHTETASSTLGPLYMNAQNNYYSLLLLF